MAIVNDELNCCHGRGWSQTHDLQLRSYGNGDKTGVSTRRSPGPSPANERGWGGYAAMGER